MSRERQSSFAGGALSPTLWGRTDIAKYGSGLRRLSNFFVSPHGVLMNRPGTKKIDRVVDDGAARLASFIFSDEDVLLLVFTPSLVCMYRDGVKIHQEQTDYNAAALPRLVFSQVNDVVTITHPSYPTRELSRLNAAGTDWEYRSTEFTVPAFPAYGGVPRLLRAESTQDLQGADGDEQHPMREWSYAVTRIMRDAYGQLYETTPSIIDTVVQYNFDYWDIDTTYDVGDRVILRGRPGSFYVCILLNFGQEPAVGGDTNWVEYTTGLNQQPPWVTTWAVPANLAIYPDLPIIIDWMTFGFFDPPAPAADDDAVEATRIYRGRDGRYGFIGQTEGDRFVDDGAVPDFSLPPPAGRNPFEVYEGDGETLIRTEHPSVVTHFEGRRFYASTTQRPAKVWGSGVEDYTNFDDIMPPKPSDAVTFELSGRQLQNVRALVSARNLLALTASSEYIITGAGDELITPTSVAARSASQHGSAAYPQPVVVGNDVIFIQRSGNRPMAVVFSTEGGGYGTLDISLFARNYFDGHTIVDAAYAEDPYSIIWLVRDDGVLLSLTYIREQDMLAWAEHEIAGGLVESIAAMPEGSEDGVYLVVNRDGARYIERFATRIVEDVRDAVFLDAAVTYDGRNATSRTVAVTDLGTGGAVGETVRLTTSAGFVLSNEMRIRITDPAGGPHATVRIISNVGGLAYDAEVLDDVTAVLTVVTTEWAICTNSINDLGHLEGQTVTALADGDVVSNLAVFEPSAVGRMHFRDVEAGSVQLPDYVAVVHVGLPYVSSLESLDLPQEKGRKRTVAETIVEYSGLLGGTLGQTLEDEDPQEVQYRRPEDEYGPVELREWEEQPIILGGDWNTHGRVALRQTQPLPLTVLGIARIVEYGG